MAKDRVIENCIEWLDGDKCVLCTLSQKRFINRVKKMLSKGAPLVEILHENDDGSILAKIPLKYVHLTYYAPKTVNCEVSEDDEEEEEDDST